MSFCAISIQLIMKSSMFDYLKTQGLGGIKIVVLKQDCAKADFNGYNCYDCAVYRVQACCTATTMKPRPTMNVIWSVSMPPPRHTLPFESLSANGLYHRLGIRAGKLSSIL